MFARRPRAPRTPRWPAVLLTLGLLVGCAAPLVAKHRAALLHPASAAESVAPPSASVAVAPPAPAAGAAQRRAPDLRPLQARLKEYLAEQEGTYGVYVIDIQSGRGTGVNADAVFPTASTFKLPLAMYILDEAAHGRVNLDEELAYTDADWEDGTGILQESVWEGAPYTIRELVQVAITESDNIATNMLLRRFGAESVFDYMKRLGGTVTHYEDRVTGTTPREMAGYLRSAMSSRGVGDRALRQFLFDSLTHTRFSERVEAGVPSGVAVAHKIGTLPGVVNDVALVYAPQRQFIVSVFSSDVEEETGKAVIAQIARMVYEHETELE